MPFSIEALQCKSKLNNVRNRQFSQTLWPELRQKEENTITQSATHNFKSAVRAFLARVRGGAKRDDGGNAPQEPEPEAAEEPDILTTNENDDGFLEVNITKRIRTGNKLPTTSTTADQV